MVRIFSFDERWNVPFNSAVASLNGTFHLSPHENILTIARIKTFIIGIMFIFAMDATIKFYFLLLVHMLGFQDVFIFRFMFYIF
jgi:hypothetical protein